jgi:hypothetical protein
MDLVESRLAQGCFRPPDQELSFAASGKKIGHAQGFIEGLLADGGTGFRQELFHPMAAMGLQEFLTPDPILIVPFHFQEAFERGQFEAAVIGNHLVAVHAMDKLFHHSAIPVRLLGIPIMPVLSPSTHLEISHLILTRGKKPSKGKNYIRSELIVVVSSDFLVNQ